MSRIGIGLGLAKSSVAAAASTFDPSSLPGLFGWYRADLGVTLDGSNNVTTWADQSGSGNDVTQATSTKRPAYHASGGANNRPYLQFDPTIASANQQLLKNPVTAPANHDIFVVVRATGASLSGRIYDGGETLYAASGSQLSFYNTPLNFNPTIGTDYAFQCTSNGASSQLRANGASQGTGTQSASFTELSIGNYTGQGLAWQGFIYEWIGCNVLSSGDRLNVQAYLTARYGITFS